MISYEDLLQKLRLILKKKNLKYTKQRELIVQYLYQNNGHFTPEEIYLGLKHQHRTISIGIATVYRTLALLEEAGIVSSLSFGLQGKKYELGLKKHHDHLVCSGCGLIIEFYDDTIEKRQEQIASSFSFKMTDHMMKIIGLCQTCQNQS